jgi:hypothetical protein
VQTNKVLDGVLNFKADEAQGMADYRPASDGRDGQGDGRLFSHLVIPPAAVQDVEATLSGFTPKIYPAMDVVIRQLGVAGFEAGSCRD